MYPFSIGVILDSFRTDLTTALDKAAAVGAEVRHTEICSEQTFRENM